jgi:hypothetical protein
MAVYKRVRLEPHRAFLEKFDITPQTLCDRLLAERGDVRNRFVI